jgi:hypothetical protein
MKIKSVQLQIGFFRVLFEGCLNSIQVTIEAHPEVVANSKDVRLSSEDITRLNSWISNLDESNFLGAPEITFVNLDLEFEMSFVDVDDETVTITLFLIIPDDISIHGRSYKGIRGETSRSDLTQFSQQILQFLE